MGRSKAKHQAQAEAEAAAAAAQERAPVSAEASRDVSLEDKHLMPIAVAGLVALALILPREVVLVLFFASLGAFFGRPDSSSFSISHHWNYFEKILQRQAADQQSTYVGRLITKVTVKLTSAALRTSTRTRIRDFFLFKIATVTILSSEEEFYFVGLFGRWINVHEILSKFEVDETPPTPAPPPPGASM